jgi:hypothetical protein
VYDAPTCTETIDRARIAPLDLLTDLARLDERLTKARNNLGNPDVLLPVIERDLDRARETVQSLRTLAAAMPYAEDIECGYEGPVDAELRGRGPNYTAYWTCPRCDTDRSEDRTEGDDA